MVNWIFYDDNSSREYGVIQQGRAREIIALVSGTVRRRSCVCVVLLSRQYTRCLDRSFISNMNPSHATITIGSKINLKNDRPKFYKMKE